MSKLHKYVSAAALIIAAAIPVQLSAQVTLSPSFWEAFAWSNGAGFPIDGDGFTAQSSVQMMRVRVADAFVNGDAFDIYVDGVLLYQTPTVQGDGYFEDFITDDPDVAYGNPLLSYFEFFLNPQVSPYLVTLNVREGAPDYLDGGGFIRLDNFDINTTPEPGAFVLLATGLLGVAAFKRRRSLQANV